MPGSIRAKGPDRWQVRVSVGRNPATGRYRYLTREIQGTKRDAQKLAARLVTEVDQGSHRHPDRHTVAELLERWMEHIEGLGRAPSTLVRYEGSIRREILPGLGHLRIDRIEPVDIDRFYTALAKRGLKPISIRKAHSVLSASFNQAVKWGWIGRSPVQRTTPPSLPHSEVVPPTLEELGRILAACAETKPELGRIIHLTATTGCRRGEVCGLQWRDVDFDNATLTVRRSVSDAGGSVTIKGTKTHAARRLALDESTVDVLRAQRTESEQRAAAVGVPLAPDAYVWSQDVASRTPYRPDRVTGQFVVIRERLGLEHVTFHGLRHFSATALAGQGVGVRTIAGRLGHANPNVTLRTYAHFLDAADREAAAALGQLVGQLTGGAKAVAAE